MKFISMICLLCLGLSAQAQLLDAVKLQLGPKMEFFHADQQVVHVQPNVDAGATIAMIHRFNERFELQVGLQKRDASAKFNFQVLEDVTGKKETYFQRIIIPAYRSYQLFAMPCYTHYLSNHMAVYGGLGVQVYLTRTLSTEGLDHRIDYLLDEDNNVLASAEMTTYASELGAGNFFVRAEAGWRYVLSDLIQLDCSLNAAFSTLEHYSISLVMGHGTDADRQDRLYYKGAGVGLNVGARFNLR